VYCGCALFVFLIEIYLIPPSATVAESQALLVDDRDKQIFFFFKAECMLLRCYFSIENAKFMCD